ncbi:MAG TPA: hypothetical protein PKE47_04230, partial [Verrucomicrobiota bacterium]|nr:hypothetical protein [Verrucomicrobiota bacterium]
KFHFTRPDIGTALRERSTLVGAIPFRPSHFRGGSSRHRGGCARFCGILGGWCVVAVPGTAVALQPEPALQPMNSRNLSS